MSKAELRQSSLKARRSLPKESISALSSRIAHRLEGLPVYSKARVIACYVAKEDEVQTAEIVNGALSSRKMVIVPLVDPSSPDLEFREIRSLSDLAPGHFHVLEPGASAPRVPLSASDIVLVPVVAWDEAGNRLGYGRGYYDRALKARENALAVGLAFESQRHGRVPSEETDSQLDMIITEERTISLQEGRA